MNTSLQQFYATVHNEKNIRYLAVLAGLIVLGLAAWGGYSYITLKRSEEAQKALSEGIAEFDRAHTGEEKETHWDDVVRGFQTGYERYSSTWAGPFFLVYKSQALLANHKFDEALAEMTKAVAAMKKSSPLYYFYVTKLALMKLDSQDKATKDAGMQELTALAENAKNPERERALYYAGYFAYGSGDVKKAQNFWVTLLQRAAPESHWAPLAKKKLEVIENAHK
jgi:hypothetical protein